MVVLIRSTSSAGVRTTIELGKIYGVDPYTIYRWKDKLLGQVFDINTVMRLMEHSNINITAICFHKDMEEMKKAA